MTNKPYRSVMCSTSGGKRSSNARSLARNRDPYLACYLWSFVATSTAMVARDAMRATGGFDPSLPSGQDFETWLAVLDRPGATVRVLSEPLADYYVRPGSISSQIWLRRQCALRIALDHADTLERHTATPRRFLLLRTLIIHYQAASAFLGRRAYLATLAALALCPASALKMAFAIPVARKRPNFLPPPATRPAEHEPA